MHYSRLRFAGLLVLLLVACSRGGIIKNEEFYSVFPEDELPLKMDQALLTFHNKLTEPVRVFYTSDYCYKCVKQQLVTVKPNNNNASAIISTKFALTLQVEPQTRNSTLCRWSRTYKEGGHYSVWMQTPAASADPICSVSVDKSPNNAYVPLLVAALLLAVTVLLSVVVPYVYRRRCTSECIKVICCQDPLHSVDNEAAEAAYDGGEAKPSRLLSLDAFRGFALTVMVFVNYGGGGYWFFQHAPWNGLTVADLVMPWFVFIIGTSVVLAFSSMQRRGVGRLQLLRKITWRTVVLLIIGFCFLNYSPRDGPLSWSWLRIPGVLQRLGFTYFVLSLLQTFWGQKQIPERAPQWRSAAQDVLLFWPQWLIIILLETFWLCVTFLLPVPGCPAGYLGAGGIGDDGLYPNCTGGAAGYIDRWMFGDNMYRYPTCKEMYLTVLPFDPEGILGTINSIVMGFLGMQAGKIIVFYKRKNVHILCRYLVWAAILGISAAILSKCTRDGGFIPVNKNLCSCLCRSLSYVTAMGCFSFLLLGAMFFIIDVKGWWRGQPFLYPGMNSIFVYVGHSLLGFYFPFSWEIGFQQSHWELLLQNLWGTGLWVLIAFLLYRKKFFLKI
ncbi:heparan-alpha-glucosaminide N-acetyltransferase-like isoform X1 [Xiphophorus maculatus]|uniref:heparan-alpha-glucosaminide N-acetyltransferase-like isoform X1 n=2 Tax=Xiphophorus maculatus TaxID=8083 RepID=UPI000C6CC346|nr:heparan-alpha-glucosaminide N-acetyltransferase-like isoform X1 [Xiphophorus maculatus]